MQTFPLAKFEVTDIRAEDLTVTTDGIYLDADETVFAKYVADYLDGLSQQAPDRAAAFNVITIANLISKSFLQTYHDTIYNNTQRHQVKLAMVVVSRFSFFWHKILPYFFLITTNCSFGNSLWQQH